VHIIIINILVLQVLVQVAAGWQCTTWMHSVELLPLLPRLLHVGLMN
jgi:hypothetical protein